LGEEKLINEVRERLKIEVREVVDELRGEYEK